ncbi:MAG: hypothetical protein O7B27_03645 [Gammaproteobacteria bacterium]|jgi:hypothetical protein|nr:hypothetical protein [Gammaproteobacteria bacterium]
MNLKRTANAACNIVARGTPISGTTQGTTNDLIKLLVNTLIKIRETQCIARDLVADIDVVTTRYEYHRTE